MAKQYGQVYAYLQCGNIVTITLLTVADANLLIENFRAIRDQGKQSYFHGIDVYGFQFFINVEDVSALSVSSIVVQEQ